MLIRALKEEHYAHRMAIAKRLEPELNAFIRSQPQETLEQQTQIAAVTNRALHDLGLAIELPMAGAAAKLGISARAENEPRFCLRVGSHKAKYWTRDPQLVLIPDELEHSRKGIAR